VEEDHEPVTDRTVEEDDHTFDGAFDRLFRRAYGVAYKILWSREDAEDVAIETLAKASLRWRSIADQPDGWVTTVAANRSIDLWRRRRRAPIPDRPAEISAVSADRIDLIRAVARLPRRQREVVTMRYLLDRSEADTATALGCSLGTVKQHLARGLRSLRAATLDIDDAPPDSMGENRDPISDDWTGR
jgi:RNA polymerase sigma factor (sigma-70 family)